MKKLTTSICGFALCMALTGCGGAAHSYSPEDGIAIFHQRLVEGQYEAIIDSYSLPITQQQERQNFIGSYRGLHGLLGNLISTRMVSRQLKSYAPGLYKFANESVYAGGGAKETFVFL